MKIDLLSLLAFANIALAVVTQLRRGGPMGQNIPLPELQEINNINGEAVSFFSSGVVGDRGTVKFHLQHYFKLSNVYGFSRSGSGYQVASILCEDNEIQQAFLDNIDEIC